ncbi:MAG: hypothetical protein EA408_05370 [Marinilabiliales bacterium]|nr:MAG: hypothetical protein EA408_05370 [Marinilabiliales bacterium]
MRILLAIMFLSLTAEISAQILPGMKDSEIQDYLAGAYEGYVLRDPPNDDELKFMTFEHVSGDMTLLVFMDSEGRCTFTRLMVDIDYLDDMTGRYDVDYENRGDNRWIARTRGETFMLTLEEGDWMFTVTVRKADPEL